MQLASGFLKNAYTNKVGHRSLVVGATPQKVCIFVKYKNGT